MERPGFLPRQVEAAEDARKAGRAEALAEPVLDPAAQRRQRPIDAAIPGPVGAVEHGRQQHRLLGLRQRRAPPGLRPVAQALQALGVVADDRVPQRLPLHPGQPGRLRPALALQSAGDRQHPCRRPRAPLAPRQRPQPVGAGQVGPDLQRRPHRSLRLRQTDRESRQPDPRIHRRVSLSARRYKRATARFRATAPAAQPTCDELPGHAPSRVRDRSIRFCYSTVSLESWIAPDGGTVMDGGHNETGERFRTVPKDRQRGCLNAAPLFTPARRDLASSKQSALTRSGR